MTNPHVALRFMKDWRTVGDNKTNVAIQLISDICKVSDGKNLHLVRKFNENHANLTEEVSLLGVHLILFLCEVMKWFIVSYDSANKQKHHKIHRMQ